MNVLRRIALAAVLFIAGTPTYAQWQAPNHSVPVGRGAGVTGFGGAAPGTAGLPLTSNGATLDPSFQALPNSGLAPGAAGTVKATVGAGVTDVLVSTLLNPANYYVATTGNDTNNCLTSGTACLTLARVAGLINATGLTAPTTINVAAGTYPAGARFTYGNITLVGAGSGVTTISDSSNLAATLRVEFPAQLGISGVYISNTVGSDVWALYGGVVNINSDVVLGPAPTARIACQDNAMVYGNANFTVDGGPNSQAVFLLAHCGMRFFGSPPVLTFTNSPVFGEIVDAINNSSFKSGAMQFVGTTSTTNRYVLSENSSVDQEQNVTEWPGALQGALSGGGVFYNAGPTFTGSISGTTLTVTGMVGGNGALGVGNQINAGGAVLFGTKITVMGGAGCGGTCTGTGLNGTYQVNTSQTVAAISMTASSIYPCIDSVESCPAVQAAPTGMGAGGRASVSNDGFGGDYSGVVTLKAGTGAASSGALFVILHSIMNNCSASLGIGSGAALSSVSSVLGTTGAFRWLEIVWTNSAALTSGISYNINYSCR